MIERLMCDFAFSRDEAIRRFGEAAHRIVAEARQLARGRNGLPIREEGDRFVVAPEARPLVRTVAARFDAYLDRGAARHSMAV